MAEYTLMRGTYTIVFHGIDEDDGFNVGQIKIVESIGKIPEIEMTFSCTSYGKVYELRDFSFDINYMGISKKYIVCVKRRTINEGNGVLYLMADTSDHCIVRKSSNFDGGIHDAIKNLVDTYNYTFLGSEKGYEGHYTQIDMTDSDFIMNLAMGSYPDSVVCVNGNEMEVVSVKTNKDTPILYDAGDITSLISMNSLHFGFETVEMKFENMFMDVANAVRSNRHVSGDSMPLVTYDYQDSKGVMQRPHPATHNRPKAEWDAMWEMPYPKMYANAYGPFNVFHMPYNVQYYDAYMQNMKYYIGAPMSFTFKTLKYNDNPIGSHLSGVLNGRTFNDFMLIRKETMYKEADADTVNTAGRFKYEYR